jgi:hypothetical protein
MGRILHLLENCILTVIIAFGIFPIAAATAFYLAMVFHLKLASTMLICLTTLCALIWILYFCVQHEPLLPRSWLRSHFGSHNLTGVRNLWRSFWLSSNRTGQSIRSIKRVLGSQLSVTRHKRLVPALVAVAGSLVLTGSLFIGIRASRAVLGRTSAIERTQRNANANKATPKEKAGLSNRNKNKSKAGKRPEHRKQDHQKEVAR